MNKIKVRTIVMIIIIILLIFAFVASCLYTDYCPGKSLIEPTDQAIKVIGGIAKCIM